MQNICAALQVDVNINSGYLQAFGNKEGTKLASACTRCPSHLLSSIHTQLHHHQEKSTHTGRIAHWYSHPGASRLLRDDFNHLNLI